MILAIILSVAVGALAMRLHCGERIREAIADRNTAIRLADLYERRWLDALPFDEWQRLGGDEVMGALAEHDAESDRLWDEFEQGRPA